MYFSRDSGPRFSDGPVPPVQALLPATGCDPAPLLAKGQELIGQGMDAAAIKDLDQALRCDHDPKIERLLTIAACRAKQFTKARFHYVRLPEAMKNVVAQICMHLKIVAPQRGNP